MELNFSHHRISPHAGFPLIYGWFHAIVMEWHTLMGLISCKCRGKFVAVNTARSKTCSLALDITAFLGTHAVVWHHLDLSHEASTRGRIEVGLEIKGKIRTTITKREGNEHSWVTTCVCSIRANEGASKEELLPGLMAS